jgi:aminoglycoside phosphotransferase (APT) family kinase protein
MPAAEVSVPPDLVRRLLAAQQPDLAHLPIRVMAHGWDNLMYRLGDELAVRLPRRAVGAQLIVREQRWLPEVAPRLPLPVPVPVRTGRAGLGYPWPWSIVPFLPGQLAARESPADPAGAAVSLGRFLAALHLPAPRDAPVNRYRGIPLAERAAVVTENLGVVGGIVDRGTVVRVWQAALATPAWGGAPVWLHGDLHPANILVHRGTISAVIDFGDITAGDPAVDLSVAWMLLPADCRGAFRDAYRAASGHADSDDTWARARGWALSLASLAHSADNPLIAAMGRRTIGAVLG